MIIMNPLKETSLTVAKAKDMLLAIYDYCDEDCENCVFDSCITDKAYKMYTELITGIAHSFGIIDDIPFKIRPIGTRTVTESVEKLVFMLSTGNIYINNDYGDTFNSILDLLIEGTYEVVSDD